MPTNAEAVANRPLSGEELKSILRADFERLLEGEGMLSYYIAYHRIAYDITLRLHTDNPMRPESEVTLTSRPSLDRPQIESAPLSATSKDSTAAGSRVNRDITSPNSERLRHGLPLPVVTRQPDGTTQTEQVKYPPQPDLGSGEMAIEDVSAATRLAWKIPSAS